MGHANRLFAPAISPLSQVSAPCNRLFYDRYDELHPLPSYQYRHMELYFAVSGAGAVLHTLNPRLFAETLTWIVRHAQDSVLFFDPCFASLVERLLPHCPSVKHWICLVDEERMPVLPSLSPSSPFLSLHNYEALLREGKEDYVWPILEETAASSLCYTSGTTGMLFRPFPSGPARTQVIVSLTHPFCALSLPPPSLSSLPSRPTQGSAILSSLHRASLLGRRPP